MRGVGSRWSSNSSNNHRNNGSQRKLNSVATKSNVADGAPASRGATASGQI